MLIGPVGTRRQVAVTNLIKANFRRPKTVTRTARTGTIENPKFLSCTCCILEIAGARNNFSVE